MLEITDMPTADGRPQTLLVTATFQLNGQMCKHGAQVLDPKNRDEAVTYAKAAILDWVLAKLEHTASLAAA